MNGNQDNKVIERQLRASKSAFLKEKEKGKRKKEEMILCFIFFFHSFGYRIIYEQSKLTNPSIILLQSLNFKKNARAGCFFLEKGLFKYPPSIYS